MPRATTPTTHQRRATNVDLVVGWGSGHLGAVAGIVLACHTMAGLLRRQCDALVDLVMWLAMTIAAGVVGVVVVGLLGILSPVAFALLSALVVVVVCTRAVVRRFCASTGG